MQVRTSCRFASSHRCSFVAIRRRSSLLWLSLLGLTLAAGCASEASPDRASPTAAIAEEDLGIAPDPEFQTSQAVLLPSARPAGPTKPAKEYQSDSLFAPTAPIEALVSQPPADSALAAELPVSENVDEVVEDLNVKAEPAQLGNTIEVFFATDRLPTAQLLPSALRTFAPAGVVAMIAATLFIGFSLAKRFLAFWLVGCGMAVCLSMMVLHASIIRWQQFSRLASNSNTRFSTLRDDQPRAYPLHVGTARVSLPSTHKPGRFEQPKLFQFEFVESPKQHIVLHSLTVQDSSEAWFNDISSASQYSEGREAFIFIHGYNVHFIDAVKRTAQLANDLDLNGPAICYSWPSQGALAGYRTDEASVSWSAPHFEKLLIDIHARTDCQRLNVIAHSMGNRALLEAVELLDRKLALQRPQGSTETVTAESGSPTDIGAQPATGRRLIDSLVMAAPDVDLAEFTSRYLKPLQNIAARSTLYFSDSDRALLVSAGLHGAPRLGLIRDNLQAFAGIDSIYVGAQSGLALGHSYYGDDPAVIDDLKHLLRNNKAADERDRLRRLTTLSGHAFWQIDRTLHARLPTAQNR